MLFLVTGASGMVGSGIARRLVSDDRRVRCLVRQGSRLDLLGDAAQRVEIVEGDVTESHSIDEAMDGVTHVFHCAAYVGFPGRRGASEMHAVNVDGAAHVVNSALRARVTRLVHTSSVAAIGRPELESGCLDENTAWSASRYNTGYGRSKHMAEVEIARGVAEGLDAVMVNPCLVFGRSLPGENTWGIVERVKAGKLPGYPTGATNVVDVDDVVTAHVSAMEMGRKGERYVIAGDHLTWRDILHTLAAAFDVEPPARRIPAPVMTAIGTVSEWAGALFRFDPRVTRESARVSSRSTCYDASRARTELGWTHRPFAETAARLAALFSILVVLSGCGPRGDSAEDAGDRPTFVATFHAVATIARAVAGDRADVVTLMDPGVSPHTYEPRPSDLRQLAGASATVYAAAGLDSWLVDLGVPAPHALFDHVPDSLRILVGGVPDPHFWLSPPAVAAVVPTLATHFCEVDPDGCEGYRSRAGRFIDSLLTLDRRLVALLAPVTEEKLVASSTFLSYFAARYGPDIVEVVELVEGVEPSPSRLSVVTGRTRSARAVVGQPWLPENAAWVVAEGASIPYVTVDPLGSPSSTPTYESLLLRLAADLIEASHDR